MAEEKGRLSGGKKGIEVSSEVMDKINGPAKKRMKSENNGAYSIVRDVPSYILQIARAAFPKARNNTDALVAYLAIMCPEVQDSADFNRYATDAQKDLVDEANTGLYSELSDRMLSVKKKLDLLAANDMMVKVMLYMLVADRYGLAPKMNQATFGESFDLAKETLGPFMDELYALSTFFDKEAKEFGHIKSRRDGRPANF